jgi:hypothetical protein
MLWDYRLGLRGAGLIVYGALPASLSALGAVKIEQKLPLSVQSIPFIAVVALAPIVLTFMLTKQRMAAWYVLNDYVVLRSILNTFGIVVASTAVCLATRALTKPDSGAALCEWLRWPLAKEANTLGHALLLSLAFLVGSSTLFLTVIKEDGGLPLLPSKDRLAMESGLRKSLLVTVAAAREWPIGVVANTTLGERSIELNSQIAEAEEAIAGLRRLAPGLGRMNFFGQLAQELDALRRAILEVSGAQAQAAHDKYWAATPNNLNAVERERRALVQRHAELSVHA